VIREGVKLSYRTVAGIESVFFLHAVDDPKDPSALLACRVLQLGLVQSQSGNSPRGLKDA
jgi:hypothetical protein